MRLEIKIVLDGNQVTAEFPRSHPMHALEMLEGAKAVIKQTMMQAELQPSVEVITPAALAQRMNGRG